MTKLIVYEIAIAQPGEFFGHAVGNWDTSIGEGNEFSSVAEAEAAIKQLAIGDDDWHCLYAVREIGQSALVATYDYRDNSTAGRLNLAEMASQLGIT